MIYFQNFLQCLFLAAVVLTALMVAVLVILRPDSTLNVDKDCIFKKKKKRINNNNTTLQYLFFVLQ